MTTTEGEAGASSSDDLLVEEAGPKQSWLVQRGLLPERGPKRTLAIASFINMLGSGVFMVSAALFFTRSVGLSVAEVGLGMGVAAAVGLLSGVPVGHLADRRGPREIYLITLCIQGLAAALLVFVHTFWLFLAALCVAELARCASTASRGPLVRGVGGANLPKFRSYLRSVANLAASFGAIAAGYAVQLDTRSAYLTLILGNALSFFASAAIITRMPSLAPVQVPPKSGRWIALKDTGFVVVTVLDGIMSIQGTVLIFALPLWIVGRTDAPRWLVGGAALINTAMVVVLQVRASRGVDNSVAAGRAMRNSGVAFFVGMALIATSAGLPGWIALILITGGIAIHTVGELWNTAGSLELRFILAPAHAQGQYSGVFGFGSGLANVIAPSVVGLLCITWGAPGWLVLGAIFVLIGFAMPPVVRWAVRTRPAGTQTA